jgi:hypothetical protein
MVVSTVGVPSIVEAGAEVGSHRRTELVLQLHSAAALAASSILRTGSLYAIRRVRFKQLGGPVLLKIHSKLLLRHFLHLVVHLRGRPSYKVMRRAFYPLLQIIIIIQNLRHRFHNK